MVAAKDALLDQIRAKGTEMNEIVDRYVKSQKIDNSIFETRDKTPLENISDENVRKAVEVYRNNMSVHEAAIANEKATIGKILGLDDAPDFDKTAEKAKYESLKDFRASTLEFMRKTKMTDDAEISSLPEVKSWSGGVVSDSKASRPRFESMSYSIGSGDDVKTFSVDPATSGNLAKVLNKAGSALDKDWKATDNNALTALFVEAAGGNLKSASEVKITVGPFTVTAVPKAEKVKASA